jgi:hypothetical protein
VVQRLRASGSGVDSLLASVIPAGVAYHHSGNNHHARVSAPSPCSPSLTLDLLQCKHLDTEQG